MTRGGQAASAAATLSSSARPGESLPISHTASQLSGDGSTQGLKSRFSRCVWAADSSPGRWRRALDALPRLKERVSALVIGTGRPAHRLIDLDPSSPWPGQPHGGRVRGR
jgi:hypothetical protein